MAKPTSKDREILDLAMKRLEQCQTAEQENRSAAIEDLQFLNGQQWDEAEVKRRKIAGRPALKINMLPKFVNQVVGDMLQNTPSIHFVPSDSNSNFEIAKIREGIMRDIEYYSDARAVYGYGGKQMVSSGYGAWRVLTRYTEENPFLQEIYLEAIRNPFLVYLDPTAKDQHYSDGRFGFVLEKLNKQEFENRYPGRAFPEGSLGSDLGISEELWWDGENFTVAEYFTVEDEKVTYYQLEDGSIIEQDDYDELKAEYAAEKKSINSEIKTADPEEMNPQELLARMDTLAPPQKIIASREGTERVIKHRIITAFEILEGGTEGKEVPGKFIPIVLLKGPELNIEGKNFVYSLIRNAKDPQKMLNYWNTTAAETIALSPKAPWLGTAKQFEGYENDYAAANVENFAFLKYNADPDAGGAPQRVPPAQAPVAIFEQIRRGEENLKSVIGMFNADVGGPTSQQTGAAVRAIQLPGDVGTFEFIENWGRAIQYTGRIVDSMIPEVYDSEREVRVKNLDSTDSFVPVNTTAGGALQSMQKQGAAPQDEQILNILKTIKEKSPEEPYNDITKGRFEVKAELGPSYSTQRQESADRLMQMMQAMPQQMALAADIIVENMDFKDADELAYRLRRTLPPGVAKPRKDDPPPQPQQPAQPDPNQIMAQAQVQAAQAQVEIAKMKVESEKLKMQLEQMKAQTEIQKMKMELEKARLESQGDTKQPTPQYDPQEWEERNRRFALDQEKLALEKAQFAQQSQMDAAQLQHQVGKDRTDQLIQMRGTP